jgi:hypothetical protein
MRILALFLLAMLASSCESAALKYARGVNTGCQVTPLEEKGDSVRVLVACPNEDPTERVYRGR